MDNQNTNQVLEVANDKAKISQIGILIKNPYVLGILILVIALILWAVFKKGKSDESVAIPEIKIDDIPTNINLGKTEKDRKDFNIKATSYAKKVFDLTESFDPGLLINPNAKEKAQIYGEMVRLNKTQLTLINDRWIDKWFTKNSESMYTAIDNDNHWYLLSPANEKALLKLLKDYELNTD